MNKTDKKGFTLIELLIVIAILGILTAVVVISYTGAQTRSKIAKTKGDLLTLSTAVEMYKTDNKALPFNYKSDCGKNDIGNGYGDDNQEWRLSYDNDNIATHIGNGGLTKQESYTPSSWNGPYIGEIIDADPWGNRYEFDPDYLCNAAGSGLGDDNACAGVSGHTVRSVRSYGPNKTGEYGGDGISILICKQ